jgi:hypothetical protein
MAAKICNYQYYKYFMPDRKVTQLTDRQISMIGQMDPARKFKYLGALSKSLDDDSMAVFRQLEQIAPQRFKQMTRIGVPLNDKEKEAVEAAQRMAQELAPGARDQYDRVADKIAQQYRKKDILSDAERQILYPVFAKQMQELPTLVMQLDSALAAGDEQLAAYLTAQLTKTITAATAIAGDKNAVSVAMKSFENLNKVLNKGGQLPSILANGVC